MKKAEHKELELIDGELTHRKAIAEHWRMMSETTRVQHEAMQAQYEQALKSVQVQEEYREAFLQSTSTVAIENNVEESTD